MAFHTWRVYFTIVYDALVRYISNGNGIIAQTSFARLHTNFLIVNVYWCTLRK